MSFRFEIHLPFGPPLAQPLCIPIVASHQLSACESISNIWLVPQVGGEEIAAISLGWEYGRLDMLNAHWIKTETDAVYLASAVLTLQTELNELIAKSNRDTDDEYRIWELEDSIRRLQFGHFWEEQVNALGDNCVALYRSVSAPNVPWTIRSAGPIIEANRAFTVHFFRCQMPTGQARKRLYIRWDKFEIEFPSDGPEAKLRVINPELTNAQIAEYKSTIQSFNDQKYLTPEDENTITEKRRESDEIKAEIRTRGPWYKTHPVEKAAAERRIETLRKEIETIKSNKGLTPYQERQLKDAEKDLYVLETSADLGISSQSGTDQLIQLTVVPDPRGYLVLHANPGNHTSVHKLKWMTASNTFGNLWESSHLELESDGGAFMFRFDNPVVARWGSLESRDYQLSSKIGDIGYAYDAFIPNGTTVHLDHELSDAVPKQKLKWTLSLESNNRVEFPFIYTMTLEAGGSPRADDSATLFTIEGTKTVDYVPIVNDGKLAANCVVMDESGNLDLHRFENYQVRVFDRNRQVMQGVLRNIRFESVGVTTKKWQFDIADRWYVLEEDLIWSEPPADAKELSAYLKQMVLNRGFHENECRIQPTIITLPRAPSGEKYRLNPKPGTKRSQWMKEIIENHALRTLVRFDAQGNFCIAPASVQANTSYRYHRNPQFAGSPRQAVSSVQMKLDFADFYNAFTILGAKNPLTGIRYASRWLNSTSVFKQSAYDYIGMWRIYPPVEDESLLTQDECDRVCRKLFETHGKPKIIWEYVTYYDDELRENDWIYFENKPVEIVSISSISKQSDRMTMTVRELEFQSRSMTV